MSNLVEIKRFPSKNYASVAIVYQDRQRLTYHVGIVPGKHPEWLDWPIRYNDGSITYDKPEYMSQTARALSLTRLGVPHFRRA